VKTFDDLIFENHPIAKGLQSKMFFNNGYGISVVRFKIANANLTEAFRMDGFGYFVHAETNV
jgi:hypothetical protein